MENNSYSFSDARVLRRKTKKTVAAEIKYAMELTKKETNTSNHGKTHWGQCGDELGLTLVQMMTSCHFDPGTKFQWNLNQNTIFIQENAIENVVREMAAILSKPQSV